MYTYEIDVVIYYFMLLTTFLITYCSNLYSRKQIIDMNLVKHNVCMHLYNYTIIERTDLVKDSVSLHLYDHNQFKKPEKEIKTNRHVHKAMSRTTK